MPYIDDTSVWINLAKMPAPKETFGVCKNYKICRNFDVILGDGYCVECWDRGHPRPAQRSGKRRLSPMVLEKKAARRKK